jgi:hypothetical protein
MVQNLIKKFTLFVFLIATCNFVWQIYRMHRDAVDLQRAYEEYGVIVCKMGPAADESSRFYIEIFLLTALIGSRIKGLGNALCSVIGLSGGILIYLVWWQYVFRIAMNAEISVEAIPHSFYLYRGNFLDLSLVMFISLLILLNVWQALDQFVSQTSEL